MQQESRKITRGQMKESCHAVCTNTTAITSHRNRTTSTALQTATQQQDDVVVTQSVYQVGKKCVQMLTVSLVSWKRLRMQSVAELRGWR
ncbi:hypothetical protein EYF80_024873 [Liparis tanakae]|uniref:Uncharacterized protein n=1 Tax=Liparis tanakae TaxID=230148 RepID=A0A4Z2HHX9_9TELE|nr:hypothetical protein EYF80_024873 [Liparis tanakae]